MDFETVKRHQDMFPVVKVLSGEILREAIRCKDPELRDELIKCAKALVTAMESINNLVDVEFSMLKKEVDAIYKKN